MPEELEHDWMEELHRALEVSDASALLAAAENVHYADLSALYQELDDEKRDLLLKTIGPEMATDMVAELPDTLIEGALDHFKPAQLKVLLGNLSDDDRVDVFQDVDEETQGRYFGLLGAQDKELTKSLLKYEEDTAGGRMTTKIGRLTADMTVKQAITVLQRDREDTETLARIFVVDKEGRLVGKLRLRDLAFNTWDTPISDLMMTPEWEQALAFLEEKENNYKSKFANPYVAAAYGYIDAVIEPKETRNFILHALEVSSLKVEISPTKKHGVPPF